MALCNLPGKYNLQLVQNILKYGARASVCYGITVLILNQPLEDGRRIRPTHQM